MEIKIEETQDTINGHVKKALELTPETPEEAAKNIDRSRFYDMTPDSYASLKDELGPEVESMERMPANITKETEEYITQSQQHAALAKEDLGVLDSVSRRLNYYKNQILEIPTINREITDLSLKKIQDGQLSEGEEEHLNMLNEQMNELGQQTQDLGVGGVEEFGVQVASATGDFIRSYTENLGILGAGVGGGAAAGAAFASFLAPGLGTVAGATAGATKGFIGASTVIGFLDGYKQMTGGTYNELSRAVNEEGERLNLPHSRISNVSRGVGLLSGIASGVAGKVLASSNPMLKRFASPKLATQLLTKNAAVMAKMEILGGIAESVVAEGGAEALTEFVKTIGVNFAQMDETEASLMNALDQATDSENIKRYAESALLGGATGGVISGGMGAIGRSNLVERYTQVQTMAKKREEVLTTQNTVLQTANDIKETKMYKTAPHEVNGFLKKLVSVAGIDENFYFELNDLKQFADTPDKAAALKKVFGENNQMLKLAEQLDNPIEMHRADTIQLVTEFPELSDLIKTSPDGENPIQARDNAKKFVQNLKESEEKRNLLLQDLGVDDVMSPETQAELEQLSQSVTDSTESFNEDMYLRFAETFNNDNNEVTSFDVAHFNARKAVSESLKAEVNDNYDRIENRIYKDVDAKDIQADIKALDRELKIVDRFMQRNEKSEAALAIKGPHKNKTHSALAIDPRSMPEDLRAIYLDNEVLKKRRVFVDGGIDIQESAALNGVETGAELLKILAETPSKKQIRENRAARQTELQNRIKETVKPTRLNEIDRAYTDLTKIHLREMDHMRTKEWTDTKRGIIKIATQTPKIENLAATAKATIGSMPLKRINPRKFEVGERNVQKSAVKDFVNGRFEQAFANKEKAALNSQMAKEAYLAQDKIAKNERFWKKVGTAKYQQDLKDAGYLDAMNDLMDLYRLDGSNKNQVEQDSFNNFIKGQTQLGKWVPTIPERLNNTQISTGDLSLDQYNAITELGQYLVNNARTKNKLQSLADQRNEMRTVERIADDIKGLTEKHYDYDPSKSDPPKEDNYLSTTELIYEGIKTSLSALSSMKTIISQLDEHKANGYFYKLFGANVKKARTDKRAEIGNLEKRFETVIDEFYGSNVEFKKMFNEFVEIDELKDVATIGDGKGNVRKVDLLTLQAYMGDPDGKKAMENFVTRDGRRMNASEIQAILDKHLESKDVAFLQNFMLDNFKQFEQRSLDLHKRTTGDEVELVKGEPFVHRGKVYPGGYYPIKRQMLPAEVKEGRKLNKKEKLFKNVKDVGATILGDNGLVGAKENDIFSEMRSSEMTQQGRYKERTGSQRPLDISFENLFSFTEELVHDLHFREVGMDNLKLLKDPDIAKSIKSVVGNKKYISLLNSMKDTISKTTERESTLFGEEQRWLNSIIEKAHMLHAVKTLGLNLTSAAIQPASLTNVVLKLGPKTLGYMSKSASKMATNITNFSEYAHLAELINPDIRFEKDGVDNAIIKQSFDFVPKGRRFFQTYKDSASSSSIRLKELQNKAIQGSFFAMKEADRMTKILTTLAVSEQFLNGDVDGFSKDRVDAMSESERAKTMREVVQQAIDLTLTASAPEDKTAFEKVKVSSLFSRYWVDARNGLNTMIGQADRIRGNVKRGEYNKAATNAAMLALTTGMARAYMNTIRDNEESIIGQLKGVKNTDDLIDFAARESFATLMAPLDVGIGALPGINAIKYQTELDVKGPYRNVSVPLFGVASDIASGVVITKDLLEMAKKRISKGKLPTAKLSNAEQKLMLANAGYLLGGAPTNKMYSALETLQSRPVRNKTKELMEDIKTLNKEINGFIKMFKDEEDAEVFIEDLKEYQQTLPQFEDDDDLSNIIPAGTTETFAKALSNNDWKKVNPETGAAGVYQFTEERWSEIMALNPDLGLTENGRVSKSQEQQEKAMEWVISDNTRGLMAYELPVTKENLLGVHEFGFDNFAAIMDGQDNEKLADVLGDYANNPAFKNFKTVKSVKDYLKNKVK